MKSYQCCWGILFVVLSCSTGFAADSSSIGVSPVATSKDGTAPLLNWQVGKRDYVTTERVATETVTNSSSGEITTKEHKFIEAGSGLNYLDESGTFHESQDLIEILPDGGAAAQRRQTKVQFASDISQPDAITLTSSNHVIKTSPIGLYYFDSTSGKSARISGTRSSVGELLPPNRLVFKNMLDSIKADLVIIASRAALESDLVLLERPKPPQAFGLPAESRLELWHAISADTEPNRKQRVIQSSSDDPALRAKMAEPDLIEESLEFGNLWFPQGRAFFATGDESKDSNKAVKVTLPSMRDTNGVQTAKRLLRIDDADGVSKTVLIESVPWKAAQAQLQQLPEMALGPKAKPAKERLIAKRQLPRSANPKAPAKSEIRLARSDYKPKGWTWDWIAVDGSGSYTFTNATYYIASAAYFSDITILPGAIIKEAYNGYLLTYNSLTFSNGIFWPIITSADEDMGETLPTSTHVPSYSGWPALWLYYMANNVTITNLAIRWANVGVVLDGDFNSLVLSGSSLDYCVDGFICSGSNYTLDNCTKCSVLYYGDGFTDLCGPDANGNGFPDLYEFEHFGNLNQTGAGDFDGDGVSNMTEYLQGRNPAIAGTLSDTNNLIQLRVFTPLK
jgi:hypothetical protein